MSASIWHSIHAQADAADSMGYTQSGHPYLASIPEHDSAETQNFAPDIREGTHTHTHMTIHRVA